MDTNKMSHFYFRPGRQNCKNSNPVKIKWNISECWICTSIYFECSVIPSLNMNVITFHSNISISCYLQSTSSSDIKGLDLIQLFRSCCSELQGVVIKESYALNKKRLSK